VITSKTSPGPVKQSARRCRVGGQPRYRRAWLKALGGLAPVVAFDLVDDRHSPIVGAEPEAQRSLHAIGSPVPLGERQACPPVSVCPVLLQPAHRPPAENLQRAVAWSPSNEDCPLVLLVALPPLRRVLRMTRLVRRQVREHIEEVRRRSGWQLPQSCLEKIIFGHGKPAFPVPAGEGFMWVPSVGRNRAGRSGEKFCLQWPHPTPAIRQSQERTNTTRTRHEAVVIKELRLEVAR
jgi:hypothetical protein